MIDVINILSSIVIDSCIESLSTVDIWNINSIHTSQILGENMDTIDSWIHICDSLTRLFWPNNGANPWTGSPHIPKNAQLFRERLNEIKVIKNLYTQIATIFNEDNQMDKIVLAMFHPFAGMISFLFVNLCKKLCEIFVCLTLCVDINILDVSTFGAKKWKKAVSQFEIMLQPIDEKMASLLKPKLNNHLRNPRQVQFNKKSSGVFYFNGEFIITDNSHFLAIRLNSSSTVGNELANSRTRAFLSINK